MIIGEEYCLIELLLNLIDTDDTQIMINSLNWIYKLLLKSNQNPHYDTFFKVIEDKGEDGFDKIENLLDNPNKMIYWVCCKIICIRDRKDWDEIGIIQL